MTFTGGTPTGFTGSKSRGTDQDGTATVLPAFKMRWGNDVLSVEMESEGLELAIGASSLVDYVSTALLLHHVAAIKAGRTPGGSAQAKLKPDAGQGRLAAEGKRPAARGWTGKQENLPDLLTRSVITSQEGVTLERGTASGPRQRSAKGRLMGSPKAATRMGVSATATIRPGNNLHAQWLIDEGALGHEYFAIVGEADGVITKVVADYLATVLDGPRYYEKGKFQARDAG